MRLYKELQSTYSDTIARLEECRAEVLKELGNVGRRLQQKRARTNEKMEIEASPDLLSDPMLYRILVEPVVNLHFRSVKAEIDGLLASFREAYAAIQAMQP